MSRVAALAVAVATLAFTCRSAAAQDLEPVLDRVAAAWSHGDAASVAALISRDGVSIEIDGDRVGPLGGRQAAAVLRRLFDRFENVRVKPGMARKTPGTPQRAFGELNWTTRARGTTIPEHSTVVLALVLENDRWRITEIRHIR